MLASRYRVTPGCIFQEDIPRLNPLPNQVSISDPLERYDRTLRQGLCVGGEHGLNPAKFPGGKYPIKAPWKMISYLEAHTESSRKSRLRFQFK
jgi:hypothetical protein